MKKALWTTLPFYLSKQLSKPPKTKRLARRTIMRAAEESMYHYRARKFLRRKENRQCCACPLIFNDINFQDATEVHHWRGRRGKLLLFEPWWKPVCSTCHFWITNHPKEASDLNLRCPIGDWNKQPPAEALAAFERNQSRKEINGKV